MYQDGKTDMKPHMPTAEANLTNALPSSYEFWVDHDSELNERFNAWLGQLTASGARPVARAPDAIPAGTAWRRSPRPSLRQRC